MGLYPEISRIDHGQSCYCSASATALMLSTYVFFEQYCFLAFRGKQIKMGCKCMQLAARKSRFCSLGEISLSTISSELSTAIDSNYALFPACCNTVSSYC